LEFLEDRTLLLAGDLDPTFGTGGKVLTGFGSQNGDAAAVALQADGKIVVAGSASTTTNSDFAVARYNTDGRLDTTFGSGGLMTFTGACRMGLRTSWCWRCWQDRMSI
jgi:uncharacterized delta-60 repeat protein